MQNFGDINEEIGENSKAPFVRNFRENYEGGYLQIYALVEVFSFVHYRSFIRICLIRIKRLLQRHLGVGYIYFESWLRAYRM